MKCVKCGAELKEGCVYCSACGQEVQVAPDYSVLEDDCLRSLLREDRRGREPDGERSGGTHPQEGIHGVKKPGRKKKKSSLAPVIAVCCLLVIAVAAGVSVKLYVDYKNANSYDYQVRMAESAVSDLNYETALGYYKTALSLRPQDISTRMAMADLYLERKEYDPAMVLLIEITELDRRNLDAYRKLIRVCEAKKDYDSILELASGVTDAEISGLFREYMVSEPVISPAEGEYNEFILVSVFSPEDCDIYYTVNGDPPDRKNGTLYSNTRKIPLDGEGEYEIQAVCRNAKGIYSEVVTSSYVIRLLPPEYATVTPDGGRFSEPVMVTIRAEADCDIYYTWDGTDPTRLSARYTGPVGIPEGNNILSVLVVNRINGLDSGVYRTNFIYYPQKTGEETA